MPAGMTITITRCWESAIDKRRAKTGTFGICGIINFKPEISLTVDNGNALTGRISSLVEQAASVKE